MYFKRTKKLLREWMSIWVLRILPDRSKKHPLNWLPERGPKNRALAQIARSLSDREAEIIKANREDLERSQRKTCLSPS